MYESETGTMFSLHSTTGNTAKPLLPVTHPHAQLTSAADRNSNERMFPVSRGFLEATGLTVDIESSYFPFFDYETKS